MNVRRVFIISSLLFSSLVLAQPKLDLDQNKRIDALEKSLAKALKNSNKPNTVKGKP